MLKRQHFKDNESDKKESRLLKRLQLDVYDNKKKQVLDKYEDNSKGKIYVLFLFVAYLFLPRMESNCLTNQDEATKSLNYLIYILKVCC